MKKMFNEGTPPKAMKINRNQWNQWKSMQIWWFHDFSKILKHHFASDSSGGTENPWPSSCEKDFLKKVCVSFDGFSEKRERFSREPPQNSACDSIWQLLKYKGISYVNARQTTGKPKFRLQNFQMIVIFIIFNIF